MTVWLTNDEIKRILNVETGPAASENELYLKKIPQHLVLGTVRRERRVGKELRGALQRRGKLEKHFLSQKIEHMGPECR